MKRRFSIVVVSLVISLLPGALDGWAQTRGGSAPANPAAADPLKVALLHWYAADITTNFSVGDEPLGVAFDGANIWTANFGAGTVTKLAANDGTVLGTYTIGTGVEPYGITFDGANMWVSNLAAATVTKLQASNGQDSGYL